MCPLCCSPILEALSGRTLIPTGKVSLSVPPRGPAIPSLRPQNSGILPLKTSFLDANHLFRGIPLFDNRSLWKIASPSPQYSIETLAFEAIYYAAYDRSLRFLVQCTR